MLRNHDHCIYIYIAVLKESFLFFTRSNRIGIILQHIYSTLKSLVWFRFLCLIAYQPSWDISCQSHPCRRTAVVFLTLCWWGNKEIHIRVKLVNVVEGDPKAPFSIAATPFSRLPHFTLDTYLIMMSVKQGGIKYYFLSLWYHLTWDWTYVSQAISEHSNHPKVNVIMNREFELAYCRVAVQQVS